VLEVLRDLIAHKGYANAAMLAAIHGNGAAASDPDVRQLLQHILLANRFWLLTVLGLPFVLDEESRAPDSFADLVEQYHRTHAQESTWIAGATEAELARTLSDPRIPGGACSVAEAMVQVCLHTQGHRAQCATRLRRLGGIPPTTDFIVWRTSRASPQWPATANLAEE
jgi:uncharacterized damage-inducible protein DinB